jgi:N-acetylglucosamine-6-sulfatase
MYALLGLAVACALSACFPSAEGKQPKETAEKPKPPNVVLILTDDLTSDDINPNTLEHMPNLKKLLVEKGTTFDDAFVTNPVCCPSRATILRGQYAHNHQVLHNQSPLGGAERFGLSGDDSTAATWLEGSGYRTAFFGKYLNGYAGAHVPPGWDEWSAVSGSFLSHDLSENGRVVSYDANRYHLDDVLSEKASAYAERAAGPEPPFFTAKRPFFMWIGTKAPHQPATPAPRDDDTYPDLPLREGGELDNTYIFFTSDHGFHLGEHRLGAGKWTAYEEDVRVPLVVRGPGVPEGRTLHHMVLNNDLAPTFAELEAAEAPSFVDGRSLAPLLTDNPTPQKDWRGRFLIEAVAERGGVPRPPL